MPELILIKYWINEQHHAEICHEISERNEYDSMKNNGDKYLLSLLKRTCENNNKQQSKVPVWHAPVFVKIYPSNSPVNHIELTSEFHKRIFFYQNPYSYLHISDIFHPPSV